MSACQRDKRVAIVSNNFAEAVTSYLTRAGLSELVLHVEGRDANDPTLMKPSPYLIRRAADSLGVRTRASVFIGDQTSDMEAGHDAGCRTVGYANKPGKSAALTLAGADAVTTAMAEAAAAIR